MSAAIRMTRRLFLALSGAVASVAFVGCNSSSSGGGDSRDSGVDIYRLSSRGRRTSNAAKLHNANKRFATEQAARENRAHPGDTSRVVMVRVSDAEFRRMFASGGVFDYRS